MNRRLRRVSRREPAELNITAFMNLMVILVPFLLITAVFTPITILELDLPSGGGGAVSKKKSVEPEVIVRRDSLEVGDRHGGTIRRIVNRNGQYDLKTLSGILQEIKARIPERKQLTILLEPDVSYDHIVQVMDVVRVVELENNGELVQAELFPQISIGDAPVGHRRTASRRVGK